MEWIIFPGIEGFGKRDLLRLEGKFLTFPREGKFTSSHFMGGEKFLVGLRGAKNFSIAFRIVFRILFRVFQTVFRIDLKIFRGQIRSARVPP